MTCYIFCIFLIFNYILSPCNNMVVTERSIFMRNVLFKTGKVAWKILKETLSGITALMSFVEAVAKKKGDEK